MLICCNQAVVNRRVIAPDTYNYTNADGMLGDKITKRRKMRKKRYII